MRKKLLLSLTVFVGVLSLVGCASKGPKSSGNLTSSNENAQAQTYGASDSQIYGQGLASSNNSAVDESLPAICTPPAADAQQPDVNQHYFFAFNKSDLTPQALASIKVQAQYLVSNPNAKIRIEGNTDDRGSREYNVGLGWRRAKAVEQSLQQYGVNAKQLVMVSYGAEKPAALGNTDSAYQCNRRVDLKYQS